MTQMLETGAAYVPPAWQTEALGFLTPSAQYSGFGSASGFLLLCARALGFSRHLHQLTSREMAETVALVTVALVTVRMVALELGSGWIRTLPRRHGGNVCTGSSVLKPYRHLHQLTAREMAETVALVTVALVTVGMVALDLGSGWIRFLGLEPLGLDRHKRCNPDRFSQDTPLQLHLRTDQLR